MRKKPFDDKPLFSTKRLRAAAKNLAIMAGTEGNVIVYLEYAFLENFLLDGLLLFFAVRYSGSKRTWRLPLAACLGSVSAIVYPLFALPAAWSAVYKIATGICLPLVAIAKEPPPKSRLCVLFFFAFSFFIAGGTFAFSVFLPLKEGYYLQNMPVGLLVGLFLALLCLLAETIVKARRRRQFADFFVECLLEEKIAVKGFVDTGNCARHRFKPVCFASPELFLRLKGARQAEQSTIKTMSGEKRISLVKIGKIRITQGGQTHIIDGVYLAASAALCGREYELLLGAWALG